MSDRAPSDQRTQRRRSRSPDRQKTSHSHHRQRSPHRQKFHHHRRHAKQEVQQEPELLPYNSRHLTKRDLTQFQPMFALYLDIQKGKDFDELDVVEAKGRWKSFVGKWNRGELSEGWYDPTTLQKAVSAAAEIDQETRDANRRQPAPPPPNDDDPDSDDSIGPALPDQLSSSKPNRKGPSVPSIQDLELKREMDAEDAAMRKADINYARKADRKEQRQALDELVPKAEAGTRERQLEKKKEVNEKMKSFREKSPGAEEVPETDLMGGGDGLAEFKKQKQEFERKKNDRELRREEILRARAAEREERLTEYREKEDKTMQMLKALAKQNFG